MIRFPVSFPTSLVSAGLAALLLVGCGKAPEAVSAAPSTTVGTEIDDTVVTAAVKAAVLGDAHIKSFDLKVETRKGEVQLSGFVDNQEQVERALAVVRAVAGVKSVDNQAQIDRALEVTRAVDGVGSVGNDMSIKK